jgi:hypothetical protein
MSRDIKPWENVKYERVWFMSNVFTIPLPYHSERKRAWLVNTEANCENGVA